MGCHWAWGMPGVGGFGGSHPPSWGEGGGLPLEASLTLLGVTSPTAQASGPLGWLPGLRGPTYVCQHASKSGGSGWHGEGLISCMAVHVDGVVRARGGQLTPLASLPRPWMAPSKATEGLPHIYGCYWAGGLQGLGLGLATVMGGEGLRGGATWGLAMGDLVSLANT